MLKVLIADDEVLVRIGLKSVICWEEYGFQLLEDARDGKEAIEIILRDKPDILLTDIKMPKMDGIEVIRWIKNNNMDIDTVVLSCYDSFELVKEAMKLGASDYIRKLSMKPNDLINILLQLKEGIVKRRMQVGEHTEDSIQIKVNFDLLKNEFFSSLIKEESNKDNYKLESKLKTNWDSGYSICIHIDAYEFVVKQNNKLAILNSSLKSICEQVLKKFDICGEVFHLEKDEFGIVVNGNIKEHQEIPGILQKEISNNMNISTSFGIGPTFVGKQGFVESYKLARNIRFLKFYNNRGFICTIDKLPDISKKFTFHTTTHPNIELADALDSRQAETAIKILDNIFCEIRNCGYLHIEIVKKIALELLSVFTNVSNKYDCKMDDLFDNEDELPYRRIVATEFLQDLQDWFRIFVVRFIEYLEHTRKTRYSQLIQDAFDYISRNINSSLSLSEVSKEINTSDAYLSFLFKKETGKNFTGYVNELKVKLAKDLLTKGMLVYEVSERLGFDNSNYFSKVFKKYTGITPENYRLNYKKST